MAALDPDKKNEIFKVIVWAFLPRSLGMLLGASSLALSSSLGHNPFESANLALGVTAFSWFGIGLITSLIKPGTYLHNFIWMLFVVPFSLLTVLPTKQIIYILLIGYSLFNGASIILTLLYFGGIGLYDFFLTIKARQLLP